MGARWLVGSTTGAIAGGVAVAANIGAVVVLSAGVSSAYRIDELAQWLAQARAEPWLSDLAALLFLVGCAAFAPLGFALSRHLGGTPAAQWGGRLLALAGVLNVLGVPLTVVATRAVLPACEDAACEALAGSLFRRAIEFDAAFNLVLGLGLMVLGVAALQQGKARALAVVSVLSGFITLPVALQFFSGAAARWLGVAGPLWLIVLAAWSVKLWRART